MTDENVIHPLSDYVRATTAAEMLGITRNRIYEHIRENRLPAERQGKIYFILKEDIERFKANPTGRTRTKPLEWRTYTGDVRVLATEMNVNVRPGQQEALIKKLQEIRHAKRHIFLGTLARYVLRGDKQLNSVHIVFLWKNTDMPARTTVQEQITAFQQEMADMLDWTTAQIQTNDALLYT